MHAAPIESPASSATSPRSAVRPRAGISTSTRRGLWRGAETATSSEPSGSGPSANVPSAFASAARRSLANVGRPRLVEDLDAHATGEGPASAVDDAAGGVAAVGDGQRRRGLALWLHHHRGDRGGPPALARDHRVLAGLDTRHAELPARVTALRRRRGPGLVSLRPDHRALDRPPGVVPDDAGERRAREEEEFHARAGAHVGALGPTEARGPRHERHGCAADPLEPETALGAGRGLVACRFLRPAGGLGQAAVHGHASACDRPLAVAVTHDAGDDAAFLEPDRERARGDPPQRQRDEAVRVDRDVPRPRREGLELRPPLAPGQRRADLLRREPAERAVGSLRRHGHHEGALDGLASGIGDGDVEARDQRGWGRRGLRVGAEAGGVGGVTGPVAAGSAPTRPERT